MALVIGGRPPKEIAPIVRVSAAAVRSWLRGESVPTAERWWALVVDAGLVGWWPELSAARDAVARKPTGRPVLSAEEAAKRYLARRVKARKGRKDG